MMKTTLMYIVKPHHDALVGETPVKGWLEKHVKPVIDNLVSNGSIN